MSSNLVTIPDCDGDYSDWVEIANTGSQTIDISGYGLSDSEASPKKWKFPEGTKLDES
jgi:hypothetical protein